MTSQTRTRLTSILALLLGLGVLAAPAGAGTGPAVDGDPSTTERIAPQDPIDFAIAVSQLRFADGAAATVTLSRDDNFADSLAGTPLTGDGPLLFTRTGDLPDATATELQRVLPEGGTVFILGGPVAVSADVQAAVEGLDYTVRRLEGASRVETALAVATEVRDRSGDTGTVAVARSTGPADNPTAAWADSVAAGAWVAREGHPLVISPTSSLPESVEQWLAQDAPEETVLLGGEAALSPAVAAAVPNGRRVSGADRAATAATIATDLLGFASSGDRTALVFNPFEPLGWTRGLAAAGLAAELDAPLLAVNLPGIPEATAAVLSASGADPEVDLLVAAPLSEVDAQLVAELDELDAGPPAPTRPEPGVPRIVSVNDDGELGTDDSTSPDLGGDGSLVAFTSRANNLGDTDADRQRDPIIHDTVTGTTTEISGSASPFIIGATSAQSVSGDNRHVVSVGFGIDQNAIHVWDVQAGQISQTTTMEEVDPDNGRRPNNVAISDDGQWVAFDHDGSIYRQRRDGSMRTEVVAGRNGEGFADLIYAHWISADGSRVTFRTQRDDFEGGSVDAQVFTLDVASGGSPLLVSRGVDGQPADSQVADIAMSADGSTIVYSTAASNITADEVDGRVTHLYAYDVATGQTRLIDRDPDGTPASAGIRDAINGFGLSITDDGRTVVAATRDGDLVGGEFAIEEPSIVSFDLVAGTSRPEYVGSQDGSARFPSISGDGRRIAFNINLPEQDVEHVAIIDR